jgi:hypothetical protein
VPARVWTWTNRNGGRRDCSTSGIRAISDPEQALRDLALGLKMGVPFGEDSSGALHWQPMASALYELPEVKDGVCVDGPRSL